MPIISNISSSLKFDRLLVTGAVVLWFTNVPVVHTVLAAEQQPVSWFSTALLTEERTRGCVYLEVIQDKIELKEIHRALSVYEGILFRTVWSYPYWGVPECEQHDSYSWSIDLHGKGRNGGDIDVAGTFGECQTDECRYSPPTKLTLVARQEGGRLVFGGHDKKSMHPYYLSRGNVKSKVTGIKVYLKKIYQLIHARDLDALYEELTVVRRNEVPFEYFHEAWSRFMNSNGVIVSRVRNMRDHVSRMLSEDRDGWVVINSVMTEENKDGLEIIGVVNTHGEYHLEFLYYL